MMRLSVLYNTNLVPLAICVPPPLGDLEQQGPDVVEELQEEDTSIRTKRKKKGKITVCGVVIREINMRNNDNLSILRNYPFYVIRKSKMVDGE
jgi:hypothetical protein